MSPAGPFGQFRLFHRKSVFFFFGICDVEKCVSENSGKHALDHFSWSFRSALHFSAQICGNLSRRLFFGKFHCFKNFICRNEQVRREKMRISESSGAESPQMLILIPKISPIFAKLRLLSHLCLQRMRSRTSESPKGLD